MPKVLVINRTSHDYSDAERFGELVFLSRGSISRFATNKIFRRFEKFIEQSKPEDYLLIGGHSVMCGIVCSMFAAKHGILNLLIFQTDERGCGKYLPRRLYFNNNQNERKKHDSASVGV